MPELPKHFTQTLALLKAKDPDGDTWQALESRHAEPHRHFHTLPYLAFRLDLLSTTSHDTPHLRLALYFHHIIHDPCGENNELQSARLATDLLSAIDVADKHTAVIYDLIRSTDPLPSPAIEHGDLFADLHLAWLGSTPDQFHHFSNALRQEFDWLPDTKYLRQRMNEALPLLDRNPLFQTTDFQTRFEQISRANLTAEITRLRG